MKPAEYALAERGGDEAVPPRRSVRAAWLALRLPGRPRLLVQRLGAPGAVAIGVLTACAAFQLSVLDPLEDAVAESRQTVARLAELHGQEGAAGTDQPTVYRQLEQFHRLLPRQAALTDLLAVLFATAREEGLALHQGEYRAAEDPAGGLLRYQVVLPVKADYVRIRRFLATVAARVPTAAIEHIQFERRGIGEPQVEATIRLEFFLEPQP